MVYEISCNWILALSWYWLTNYTNILNWFVAQDIDWLETSKYLSIIIIYDIYWLVLQVSRYIIFVYEELQMTKYVHSCVLLANWLLDLFFYNYELQWPNVLTVFGIDFIWFWFIYWLASCTVGKELHWQNMIVILEIDWLNMNWSLSIN